MIAPDWQRGLITPVRFTRAVLAGVVSVLFTGCGYVHFGRTPKLGSIAGDAKLAAAYSDLSTDHKILRHELALARKETDALRSALEHATALSARPTDDTLTTALQELTELRASYARLQAERTTGENITTAASAEKTASLEKGLAAATRASGALQTEVAHLRQELERTRAENVVLDGRLREVMKRHDETRATLAQRDTELSAQTQARVQAEQSAEATGAELRLALSARVPPATTLAGSSPGANSAGSPAGSPLQMAKSPPAGAATQDLREPFEDASLTTLPATPAAPVISTTSRTHVVKSGDTLEELSRDYYGMPDRWHLIYEANVVELSSGRPLRPGMELIIPDPK